MYQIGSGTGIAMPAADLPAGLPSSQVSNWSNLYAEVLGYGFAAPGDVYAQRAAI